MARIILLTLFLIVFTFPDVAGQDMISVMTYNIKYDAKSDTANNWSVREPWVTGLIWYHHPDIFGLQEALKNQVDDVKKSMKGYTYVGVGRDDGKEAGEYSPLFYDSTRFELVKSGTFWLSETPEKVSKGWDAALPRISSYAELRLPGKESFVVYNAHFDHVGVQARRESIRVIIAHLNKNFPGKKAIFMGDLNFTDDDPAYATTLKSGLKDTRDEADPYGPKETFNGFNWLEVPRNRIDYIFIQGNIQVKRFAVLTDSRYNRYPSDHFPVIVDLSF